MDPRPDPTDSDQPRDSDQASDSGQPGAGESSSDGGRFSDASATAAKLMAELQAIIDNLATQAPPKAREVGAKAADLTAVAAERAGPLAQRAANVTQDVGTRLATRSRSVAADLRRPNTQDPKESATDAAGDSDVAVAIREAADDTNGSAPKDS